MEKTPVSVVICAAGSSTRMGCDKLRLCVNGKTVVETAFDAFDAYEGTKRIIIAVSPGREDEFRSLFAGRKCRCVPEICTGGRARSETVWNALSLLREEKGLIAVHDGARPFVSTELIEKTVSAAEKVGGALPVLPSKDTIHAAKNGMIASTLDRSVLRRAQTPQIFKGEVLISAYEKALALGAEITDECGAVLLAGGEIAEVEGDEANVKITTPDDLKYVGEREFTMRIGHGYDVHRLVEGRKFILGGEEIPHELGLLGHSDADVLLHAIADSLLGALALGDIGKHFPDTDPAYKGISSLLLLEYVGALVKEKGYKVENIDSTVCCQKPKLAPHIENMRKNIALALNISVDSVSVKATTEEKLGFTGREEGVSATAVCLLSK
ncbi:MAG: 2-C-methyl-D-erythritol 2,4-cyclodiphosphate synthase [Clostridia bacterium]|nr:2-C-methyl-D-erythritol 2,4-cyclodiphosphate synthase [Clostridia bacterium]